MIIKKRKKQNDEKISIRIHKDIWDNLREKRRKNIKVYKSYQREGENRPLFVISNYIEGLIKKDLSQDIKKDNRTLITTSLFFGNPSLWKSVKNYCKNQGITITQYLEDLITRNLKID